MGKTTKPISILCIGMEPTEALRKLVEEGHTLYHSSVVPYADAAAMDSDMIIGPRCWRYLPDISDKWLPQLLKEARAAQPPRVKKAKVKKSGAAAS